MNKEKQAQGLDMQVWWVLVICLIISAVILLAPLISSPVLGSIGLEKCTLFELDQIPEGISDCGESGSFSSEFQLSGEQISRWKQCILTLQICMTTLSVFVGLFGIAAAIWKKKMVVPGRIILGILVACLVVVTGVLVLSNIELNQMIGRDNSFVNLTIHSYLQWTAWPYGIFLASLFLMWRMGDLLDTSRDLEPKFRNVQNRTRWAVAASLFGVPFSIFFGIWFLNDRSYYFVSLCVIAWCMVPFFFHFEQRHPEARELVVIAVLVSIAVAGRAAFFMIPQFKPMMAIVILAGVSMGAETGFLTGALSAFASNFLFGQGPWTPWQMFAFGIVGFLAGLIFHGRRKWWQNKALLSTFGGVGTFLIYGLIMDTASVLMYTSSPTLGSFLAMYVSGVAYNLIHGVSTVIFLLLLSGPMLRKLERVQMKYGLLQMDK